MHSDVRLCVHWKCQIEFVGPEKRIFNVPVCCVTDDFTAISCGVDLTTNYTERVVKNHLLIPKVSKVIENNVITKSRNCCFIRGPSRNSWNLIVFAQINIINLCSSKESSCSLHRQVITKLVGGQVWNVCLNPGTKNHTHRWR